jgi:twitching motility two-component system response regulator PilH
MAEKTLLSQEDVANLLMISPIEVCQWLQKGMLHAKSLDGKSYFDLQDVEHFARNYRLSITTPDRGHLRILVVDDDVYHARRLVQLFNTLSETVKAMAVHTAFDAGRKMHSFRPDVVLLDLQLPRHDGLEICRQIKSDPATRDVRIITMSEESENDLKQRAMMVGAEACLAKPLDNKALFDTIGLMLSKQGPKQVQLTKVIGG